MADNRMYMRCNGCGKLIYLAKRLGGEYGISMDYAELGKYFESFLQDHAFCSDQGFGDFDIVYETDENNKGREVKEYDMYEWRD